MSAHAVHVEAGFSDEDSETEPEQEKLASPDTKKSVGESGPIELIDPSCPGSNSDVSCFDASDGNPSEGTSARTSPREAKASPRLGKEMFWMWRSWAFSG